MATFIASGKLSASIASVLKSINSAKVDAHIAYCSGIELAARDGRCDWLNELYNGLPSILQDAMRASVADHFTMRDPADPKKLLKWIGFETKVNDKTNAPPRGFFIITGTAAYRPKTDVVQSIMDDIRKSFFDYRAQKAADTVKAFDLEALFKRFDALAKAVETAVTEGHVKVGAQDLKSFYETAARARRTIHIATVDGKVVEPKPEAPSKDDETNAKAPTAEIVISKSKPSREVRTARRPAKAVA